MKRRISRTILLCIMISVFAMPLQAWAKTEIVVADNGWDSHKLHNAIAKIVIENAYDGYIFKTSAATSQMNWQAIIAGDVDLDLESWTDNVPSYRKDVAKGDIVNIGVVTPDSKQGLYVPRYVIEGDATRGIKPIAPDLKTVKDLKKYYKIFQDDEHKNKGRLHSSPPGFRSEEILYKKFKLYGLDKKFNFMRMGSEATLFVSLVSAYNLGEPWVGYCYEPTWVSGKLDIVQLQDEPYDKDLFIKGATEFPSQQLKIVSGKYFAKKAPDLLEFLEKYRTGGKLLAEGLAYLDENKASHEEAAKWILKNNPNLLDEWLPRERANRVRAVL